MPKAVLTVRVGCGNWRGLFFPGFPRPSGMVGVRGNRCRRESTGSGYSRSAMFSAVMPASVNAGVSNAEIWTVWYSLRFLWKAS